MRGAWRTTWLLLAFMVVNFADKAVLGLAGPEIRADFGISRAEFGTAQSAFFALFSVAALGVSALTKRVRTTTLLLVLALMWSAAQLPMLWGAAGFGMLVATRVLLGAAEGPASPVAMHHVHGWFPQRERTLPTAILLVGAAVGVAVASPVLSWVISHWGWRSSFGAVGLVGIVWAVAWRIWGSEGPMAPSVGKEAARAPEAALTVPLRAILLSPTFLTAAFGSFAAYWSMSTLLTWAPDYLESVVGWDLHQASTMVGLGALANGAVLLVHGLLSRRAALRDTPPRIPVGAGAGILVALAGCATAVYGTTGSLAVKMPMMMGPMALAMVMLTVASTACARITPPSRRGLVLGVLTFVYALGGILSPLVLGSMVDGAATVSAGYEHGWLLTSGLLVAGGVLAALFCRPERTALELGVPETQGSTAAVPVAH
ncbi:MFS transporter [Streptomyces sp. SID8379]|uniref:MFS transporter n=1 Tax=unclassified Streptomyces TaxID=2593676 RepID=UPI0007C515E3|nr:MULTISPECIES: MFS transporter [unclassified Streptomyces]MYW67227.1 MFS transporter [Streptomyces sp. SID8379]